LQFVAVDNSSRLHDRGNVIRRVAIVGAGPYALSTAAFLRESGVDVLVFGEVMGFWQSMPTGMLLRSFRPSSSIADPHEAFTLERYEEARGSHIPTPTPLTDFIEYGRWFQQQVLPDVDSRSVHRVTPSDGGFRLALSDGETAAADAVVVAAGIAPFAFRPPIFDELPRDLVSHSSEHRAFDAFRGRRVVVVGGGQSALESAALLREAGADVELLVRRGDIHFLRRERLYSKAGRARLLLYPPHGIGPPGLNWIAGDPRIFRRLPLSLSGPLADRATRPAGSAWLRPRLRGVAITLARRIAAVRVGDRDVTLTLDDASTRTVDHVLLGTGFRIDVRRYRFLGGDVVRRLETANGFPRLSPSFESAVPRLYFVGAPAAASAGPGMRLVSHTGLAAAAIRRHVVGSGNSPIGW
jgi:pyridine nucleotide-disulfide oxidoreductase